jgi:hypothetical protein
MIRRSAFCFAVAALLVAGYIYWLRGEQIALSAPELPTGTVSWDGPDEGDWNVASNWSTDLVPGASDDVSIGASKIFTFIGGASTIKSINCETSHMS